MPTKQETDGLYMGIAICYSQLSKAVRATVGACLVTEHGVVLGGVNGMPVGGSNVCEDTIYQPYQPYENIPAPILVTKPECIHAELNAILKAAKEGVSCFNATMYTTLSPCKPCAAMLINAGIKKLVYQQEYRDNSGVQLLQQHGITVEEYQT